MPSGRPTRASSTFLMSIVMVVIGIAMLIRTVTAGGGPLAFGVILGTLFVAAGAGRLYLGRKLR